MVNTDAAKHWRRLLLTVLFAGVLLSLFVLAVHASAASDGGVISSQAVNPVLEQDDNGPGDGREFKGTVDKMPEGDTLSGEWTIGGTIYTVTEQTEIKQKFGAIGDNTCVKGKLSADGSYVRELQSMRDVVCNHGGGDDDGTDDGVGHGELYGKLVTFPEELEGEWTLEGFPYPIIADDTTEFNQKNGPFAKDGYVKIEFVILADGTFLAKEIKTVNVAHDDDEDGPGQGHGDDIEHHGVAFGRIDVLVDGEGEWQIGDVVYVVTDTTELVARDGGFEQGDNVRVKYWIDEAGNRVAKQIKSMPPAAGGYPDGVHKLVGFITEMPDETVDGFVGNWRVGGVDLLADETSKFEEEDGTLFKGAFVEVTYRKEGSTRLIVEMKARIMPGGGDNDHIGEVEQMDDSLAAAGAAATTTWQIGGREYVVTDATMVGNVATGDTVLVNSYTDATGAQVATRISDVTLDNLLFLPAASR